MALKPISRRDILRTAARAVPVGSTLKLISLQAAEHAHSAIREEKARASTAGYVPKFFKLDQYKALQTLCQAIIPPDERSGGALEAGAPEFIDLLTSENEDYQRRLVGGLRWLDGTCLKRYDKVYLGCSPSQQKEILDLIAYRANADKDPGLAQFLCFLARSNRGRLLH